MTRYVETFHRRNGVYIPGDVLPIPEITTHWAVVDADYWIADARASFESNDIWGLTLEDSIVAGLDYRFLFMASSTSGNMGMVSLTRCPDFVDGSILTKAALDANVATFSISAALRASGTLSPARENCYLAGIYSPTSDPDAYVIRIYKFVNGAVTQLGESSTFAIEVMPGETSKSVCFFEFSANGDALKARAWAADEERPSTWNLEVTDTSITGAGWAGVGVGSGASSSSGRQARIAFVSVSDDPDDDAYIPKDRDERRAELEDPSAISVVLLEVGVLGSSDAGTTGVDAKLLLSNTGFVTEAGDEPAHSLYAGRIASMGEFTQQVSGQDELTGRATQGFGDVVVFNSDGALDDWLRWNWTGRPFSLLVGLQGWKKCDFILAARGTVDRLEQRSKTELAFKMRDGSNVLSRKLLRNTVGGTGINADKPAPLLLGQCFNVKPVLKDEATHTYKYNDGTMISVGLQAVREGGNVISGSPGSIASEDKTNSEFSLSASPTADITVDVVGPNADAEHIPEAGWAVTLPTSDDDSTTNTPYTHNALFKLISYRYSPLEYDQIYVAPELGSGSSNSTAGLYVHSDEDPSIDQVLDTITKSIHGAWYWNGWGELMARYLDLASQFGDTEFPEGFIVSLSEGHLIGRKLACVRLIPPALPRKFYYAKNYFQQTSLVGAVGEEEREVYSSPGTLVAYEPSLSGLDQPSQHIAARDLPHKMTLFRDDPTVGSTNIMVDRENSGNAKAVGIFEFETRAFFQELEVMRFVDLTHSRYGLSSGVRGTVIGLRKNYRKRVSTVTWACQLSGAWPAVTEAYPYVGTEEFE